jgi:AcrR family transcriptional regulator
MVESSDRGSEARGYHHGNLREALVEAGVELARTGGPGAVQLRAASRQAGVSHNAAYRHFANQEDLLAAVAERCMTRLGLLMIERTNGVTARGHIRRARARLQAIGRAYIEFARTEPGWFRTASRQRGHTPPSNRRTNWRAQPMPSRRQALTVCSAPGSTNSSTWAR